MSRQLRTAVSAVLFLSATMMYAQAPGGSGMQAGQSPAGQSAGQPSSPTNPANMTDSGSPTTSYADQSFVEDTLKDDQTQVQLSQLAQQKSSSDDVKQFSQKMIDLHNQLDHQLAPLAKQLNVNEPQKPSKKEKEEMAKLEGLSGPDFDTAYLQAMGRVQQHTLKEFKQEASSQNPNIQKAAKMDTPALDQNFQVLQKLAETHNVTLDAKN